MDDMLLSLSPFNCSAFKRAYSPLEAMNETHYMALLPSTY